MRLTAVGDPLVIAELSRRVAACHPAPPGPAVYPEPDVRARQATAEEMAACQSARTALKSAEKADWMATVSYARGPLLASSGEVLEESVESLMLTAHKDARRVTAWWLYRAGLKDPGWKLESAYVWDRTFPSRISGNEIATALRA